MTRITNCQWLWNDKRNSPDQVVRAIDETRESGVD
ncbi:hypothetical protein H4W26_001813 [Nesterenkonia halotolerans]|uniref:Uncharacterized protein n=1 Tax=Nesterenkonia halotolerans TaxID=225325 RepID=A0ABR9J7V2_9MICC|nr:hypothetical protein [Nesterenkonia halotolerans]